jgi:hypothetical protein
VQEDGYDPMTGVYLSAGGLRLPAVPETPTAAQLDEGIDLLMNHWLVNFPFAPGSKVVPVMILLTMTGRGAFFQRSPLFVIDASTAGSGKNLLVDTCVHIATGLVPARIRLPLEDDAQEKVINTELLNGRDPIVWDECKTVRGTPMSMLLTVDVYEARLLGGHEMLSVRNMVMQIVTGNQVKVEGDNQRRVIPCRLVPDVEHPELRDDSEFVHKLIEWVPANRGRLLWADFVLWRNWLAQGRPPGTITLGSFTPWAEGVGGCLEAAGLGEDFVANRQEWLAVGSPEEDWGPFVAGLKNFFGSCREFTAQVVDDAIMRGDVDDLPSRPAHGRAADSIPNNGAKVIGDTFHHKLKDFGSEGCSWSRHQASTG